MKNKRSLLIAALALVVLLGGASLLYNKLGSRFQPQQLSVPEAAEELTEASESAQVPFPHTPTEESAEPEAENQTSPPQEPAEEPAPKPEDAAPPVQESTEEPAQETVDQAPPEPEEETAQPEPQLPMAPDFTVYDKAGTAVSLSDFVGKPVVVNFWASWCGPCKSEMPDFNEAWAEYGEDIHFLMVNMTDGSQETVEAASAYIDASGFTFPVFYDTEFDAAITYGVTSLPTTYFIDAEGHAIAQGIGALDMETLKRGISMIYQAE